MIQFLSPLQNIVQIKQVIIKTLHYNGLYMISEKIRDTLRSSKEL